MATYLEKFVLFGICESFIQNGECPERCVPRYVIFFLFQICWYIKESGKVSDFFSLCQMKWIVQ